MRGTLQGVGRLYMKLVILAILLGVSAFSFFSSSQAAPADDVKAIFEQKCKSCHTIGGGKLVGPDLKGLTTRQDKASAIKFISAPTGHMPNLGISQPD